MTYFKYTMTIYTPFNSDDIDVIAREAVSGAAVCTQWSKEPVETNQLPTEAISFFNEGEPE